MAKTNKKTITVYVTDEEKSELEAALAASGESKSNHFRALQGWEPLAPVPAPKGNQRAKGNRGRWTKKD